MTDKAIEAALAAFFENAGPKTATDMQRAIAAYTSAILPEDVAGLVERLNGLAWQQAEIEAAAQTFGDSVQPHFVVDALTDAVSALTALSTRLAEATAEIGKRRLTMARDQVASAMAYRDAVVAACDENLSEYKHRAREAEARAAALERELAEAERERDMLRLQHEQREYPCSPHRSGYLRKQIAQARAAALERELAETKDALATANAEGRKWASLVGAATGKAERLERELAEVRAALAEKGVENG